MKITRFDFDTEGSILLDFDSVAEHLPYLFKRITHDNYKYYDARIPFEHLEGNTYALNILKALPYCHDNNLIRCDIVGFKYANESVISITSDLPFEKDERETKTPWGTIKCTTYKNGSDQYSLCLQFRPTVNFLITPLFIDERSITFSLVSDIATPIEPKCYLTRRSNIERDYSYNCEIELPLSLGANGTYSIKLQKKGLLGGYCQNPKEIWDLVVKCDDLVFPCRWASPNGSTEYFDISDDYLAKLFASENDIVSIYTKQNSKMRYPRIKIAIIGSCYSKEAFHSTHTNIDYKRYFSSEQLWFHQSLISLMSTPIKYDPAQLVGACKREIELYAKQSLEKTFLDSLRKDPPDYLIIDNYVEIAALLYETIDHSFITESYYLVDTPLLKKMKTVHKYGISNEKRFALFRDAVDRFAVEINKILPETHIVLIRANPALKKYENNTFSEFPGQLWLKYVRKLWERNDNYFIKKLPGARVIDTRSRNFYSIKLEGLSFSSNHLQHGYYRMVMDEIAKIALLDKLKGETR